MTIVALTGWGQDSDRAQLEGAPAATATSSSR
jgi:hypothetical protein